MSLIALGTFSVFAHTAAIFLVDRGPLAKIISFRGTHLGNTRFMVY